MSKKSKNNEISVVEKEAIQHNDTEPTKAGVKFSPSVDIFEDDEALTLLADLPGVDKDNLDIHVADRQLTITGLVEKPESRFQSLYSEYDLGGYTRSFKLGDTIDPSKISAVLTDGVLTLVLSKADRLKPRKIEIATA